MFLTTLSALAVAIVSGLLVTLFDFWLNNRKK